MVEYRPAQKRLGRGVYTSRGSCSVAVLHAARAPSARALSCDRGVFTLARSTSSEDVGMDGSVLEDVSPTSGRGRHGPLVESSLGRGIAVDDFLDCSLYSIDPYTAFIRAGVGG